MNVMSSLWEEQRRRHRAGAEPLASRMRPRSLDAFVGQAHVLGEGKLLRRMLEADRLTSMILYGPPGTGKTTLARLVAETTGRRFEQLNATAAGVKEVREILERARRALEDDGKRTILFLDEIHRFNRAQQDVLLGDVERGVVTLVGATTMNPFFSVNSPLVSRSQVFQFEPLGEAEVRQVLRRALEDPEHGYGGRPIEVEEAALAHWATVSDGDARRALAALEIAVLSGGRDGRGGGEDGGVVIDLATAEQSIQRKAMVFDPTGDEHYDVISALIKSVRGSDPDAAVYWLARLLESGEDPLFIARRLAILASEDIGNADPRAITVAESAFALTERIGMPECQLTLAQATLYLATTPKSKASARAIWAAMKDVREGRTIPVPRVLRDAHYPGAAALGHGQGYREAHEGEKGWIEQDYLGVERRFYEPVNRGYERRIREYLSWLREPAET